LPYSSGSCPNCGAKIKAAVCTHETGAEKIFHDSSLQHHWVKRIIAIVVDSIIVGIATAVLGFLSDMAGFFNWLSFPFVMGLIYVLYFTIAESTFGYTVGKRIVNLKVVVEEGHKPSLQCTFIRNISKIHVLLLILDALGGFFTSKDANQKYTDQIARTTVV
jgi:uncharacterized RDD family membrane protein YckC